MTTRQQWTDAKAWQTQDINNIDDSQKKYRPGTVSKIFIGGPKPAPQRANLTLKAVLVWVMSALTHQSYIWARMIKFRTPERPRKQCRPWKTPTVGASSEAVWSVVFSVCWSQKQSDQGSSLFAVLRSSLIRGLLCLLFSEAVWSGVFSVCCSDKHFVNSSPVNQNFRWEQKKKSVQNFWIFIVVAFVHIFSIIC